MPERDFERWILSLAWLPAQPDQAIAARLRTLAAQHDSDAVLALAQQAGILPGEIGTPTLRRHLAVRHGIAIALRSYVRPAIAVPVHLFAASGEQRADPTIGWGKAQGTTLHLSMLEGTHYSIMDAPHVAQLGTALADAIDAATGAMADCPELSYAPRIALQFGRRGVSPVFCVPGAGASITAFTDVIQALDADIPIYGMQPRGLCGTMTPHIDVPSAARAYIRSMREVCPSGPYRLMGHSFGGWVVTEMARQLTAAGERVSALVVLDSRAPVEASQPPRHYGQVEILVRLVGLFEQKLDGSLRLGEADFAPLDHEARLALLLARLVEAKLMPSGTRITAIRGIVRAFGTNLNTRYVPEQQYDGPLHLAIATGPSPAAMGRAEPDELLAGWRRHAPQASVWNSEGNHMTLLSRPYVHSLGDWLSPLMKESQC
ncbi:hypothetical protein EJB06_31225 [Massilia atriviolacea]|uniref:Thioesterase TesA-like domain-containing protein n=6 Tax=Massilia atriviolacea TaxID=2495579 RepID=A0A430HC40_9BURK|nr:hypothetical protein EJB06_31225 [Massilia atriviolacea]